MAQLASKWIYCLYDNGSLEQPKHQLASITEGGAWLVVSCCGYDVDGWREHHLNDPRRIEVALAMDKASDAQSNTLLHLCHGGYSLLL